MNIKHFLSAMYTNFEINRPPQTTVQKLFYLIINKFRLFNVAGSFGDLTKATTVSTKYIALKVAERLLTLNALHCKRNIVSNNPIPQMQWTVKIRMFKSGL